jgi:hypothetical protein
LVDDHEELGRERVEVHVVAQAAAERLDRLGHVVAAPIEAPVHHRLDAAPGLGAEPCRDTPLAGRDLSRPIRARAKREGGVVLWPDEMGVGSDAPAGRSWAPVGQTPVIKRTGGRFRST